MLEPQRSLWSRAKFGFTLRLFAVRYRGASEDRSPAPRHPLEKLSRLHTEALSTLLEAFKQVFTDNCHKTGQSSWADGPHLF